MAYPYEPERPAPRDGWNLNLPVAIGVVFVFLVGVITWVIVSGGDDDELAIVSTTAPTESTLPSGPPIEPTVAATSALSTTTPPLMPSTTVPVVVSPTATTVVATAAPRPTATPTPPTVTTTTVAGSTVTVPGDLAISGHPMERPVCEGEYITILASAVGAQATPAGIERVLDDYPDSSYLRTDQACRSLAQSQNGEPIYVVFFGPFPVPEDACAQRANGTPDAYAKQLTNTGGNSGAVRCA